MNEPKQTTLTLQLTEQEAMLIYTLLITPEIQARLALAGKLKAEHERQAKEKDTPT